MTEAVIVDRDWAETPYFRKPWFIVLLFLFFVPGYLIIIWTGDTFYQKNGVVYRTTRKRKITMTLIVLAYVIIFYA